MAVARVIRQVGPHLLLAALALVWAFPTLWVLFASFWQAGHFTLVNLSQAWASAPFGRYALNTVEIVGGLFLAQAFFGAVVGFVLARYQFPGKGLVTALFLLQIVVPLYAVTRRRPAFR